MTQKGHLGAGESRYLDRLVGRVGAVLDGDLVGVYLIGSGALADFTPGLSDLDVAVVTRAPLTPGTKARLAGMVSHQALPCPARRLELVVYSAARLAFQEPWRFELNVNTGAGESDHVAFEPRQEPSHWFVLDLAQAPDHARTLLGPNPAEVFPPIPPAAIRDALVRSLDWHLAHHPDDPATVLNACRAWRWLDEGLWCSKRAAAAWARARREAPAVVERAMAARYDGAAVRLGRAEVDELVDLVRARLNEGWDRAETDGLSGPSDQSGDTGDRTS